MSGWYPMDSFSPGDGDIPDIDGTEECEAHPGVECEFNLNSEGLPECPCRKDCCAVEEVFRNNGRGIEA
jgi:hypothetical protein